MKKWYTVYTDTCLHTQFLCQCIIQINAHPTHDCECTEILAFSPFSIFFCAWSFWFDNESKENSQHTFLHFSKMFYIHGAYTNSKANKNLIHCLHHVGSNREMNKLALKQHLVSKHDYFIGPPVIWKSVTTFLWQATRTWQEKQENKKHRGVIFPKYRKLSILGKRRKTSLAETKSCLSSDHSFTEIQYKAYLKSMPQTHRDNEKTPRRALPSPCAQSNIQAVSRAGF